MEKASSEENSSGEGEDAFCIFRAPVAPMVFGETDYDVDEPDGLGLLDPAIEQEDEAPAQGVEEAPGDFSLDLANATTEETTANVLDELEEATASVLDGLEKAIEETAPSQEVLAEVEGDVEFDFEPEVKVEGGQAVVELETLGEVEGDVEFDFDPEVEVESGQAVVKLETPGEVESGVEFDFESELEFDSPEPDSNDPGISGGEGDEPELNIEIDEGKS